MSCCCASRTMSASASAEMNETERAATPSRRSASRRSLRLRAASPRRPALLHERRHEQLATAAGGERRGEADQPVEARLAELREHDRPLRRGQARPPAPGVAAHRAAGVVLQDRALELLQTRTRVEPELVGERAACLAQHLERLDLPSGAVQRHCEVSPQRLAQAVLGDERAQLPDELCVAAAREVGLDPLLERVQPHLVQPQRFGNEQAALGDVRERRAAPQRQRLRERRRGVLVAPGAELLGAARRELLEAVDVATAVRHVQHVGVAARLDRIPAERTPQIRDVPLDDVPRARRSRVAPHLVDQAARRDGAVRADHEHGEHGAAASAAEGDGAVALVRLERPEDPVVVHAAPSVRPRACDRTSGARPQRRGSSAQRGRRAAAAAQIRIRSRGCGPRRSPSRSSGVRCLAELPPLAAWYSIVPCRS